MSRDASFLGRGWNFPPRFTAGGADTVMVAGEDDIRQSLEIIFATTPGERVLRGDFGCNLGDFVFEEADRALLGAITAAVSDAVLYHETRIRLDRLEVTESRETSGLLLISIHYTVRATNSRFNLVYPFYLREAGRSGEGGR
jgi:hypothetical protein